MGWRADEALRIPRPSDPSSPQTFTTCVTMRLWCGLGSVSGRGCGEQERLDRREEASWRRARPRRGRIVWAARCKDVARDVALGLRPARDDGMDNEEDESGDRVWER